MPYLTFTKPAGGEFSFDLGGYLKEDPFDRAQFFCEVKNYTGAHDQHPLYQEYLAKCYAVWASTRRPYEFMWITWHPFQVGEWASLCSADKLARAVEAHPEYLPAEHEIDYAGCKDLAERLWLIVLSVKQEDLCLTPSMVATLRAEEARGIE